MKKDSAICKKFTNKYKNNEKLSALTVPHTVKRVNIKNSYKHLLYKRNGKVGPEPNRGRIILITLVKLEDGGDKVKK